MLKRLYSTGTGRGGLSEFFGETAAKATASATQGALNSNRALRSVPEIAAKVNPAPKQRTEMLSPLKQELYREVLAKHGKFVNNEKISTPTGTYRLHLTPEEIKAMEPSVYAKSYRIKSSWKKAFVFLRMYRRMNLLEAITQAQFSAKALGRDLSEMLLRAKADAEKMGLEPANLSIEQIWVGKDGDDRRLVDVKGRGRAGIITQPHVHIKAILRDQSYFDAKNAKQKSRLDRKVWQPLRNWTIKEDFVQTQGYKW